MMEKEKIAIACVNDLVITFTATDIFPLSSDYLDGYKNAMTNVIINLINTKME